MTDNYKNIRDALAMGPTTGPRRVIDGDSYPYVTVALPENEGRRWNDPFLCVLYEDVTPFDYIGCSANYLQAFPNAHANATLIAACDPDTIQALLDERDALEAENERLREVLKEADHAMRSVYTSCATFPQEPQHIQNAAWRQIVNALTKVSAVLRWNKNDSTKLETKA